MRRARMTIGGMLAFVVLCAIAFAALKSRTLLWAQITFTIAVTVVLASTIGAVVTSHRGTWMGAAILGWAYGVLVFAPWFSENIGPWLLSSRIINEMFFRFTILDKSPENRFTLKRIEQLYSYIEEPVFGWTDIPRFAPFSRIGHSLSMILHCIAGAFLGHFLQKCDDPPAKTNP